MALPTRTNLATLNFIQDAQPYNGQLLPTSTVNTSTMNFIFDGQPYVVNQSPPTTTATTFQLAFDIY